MCAVINMWCWHLLLVTVVILILINVCCYQHVVLAPTTSNSGYFDIDKCVLLSTCGVAPTTSNSGYFGTNISQYIHNTLMVLKNWLYFPHDVAAYRRMICRNLQNVRQSNRNKVNCW